jgi:hypothetical protein
MALTDRVTANFKNNVYTPAVFLYIEKPLRQSGPLASYTSYVHE